jgi:hypothetical protein
VGEKQNQPFQLLFNASLKVGFQGSRVTSDGGLILIRELDERLGLEKLIEEHLSDSRQGLNKLVPAGRRTSTPATVRGHAAADLGAAGPNRLMRQTKLPGKKGPKHGMVSEKRLGTEVSVGCISTRVLLKGSRDGS